MEWLAVPVNSNNKWTLEEDKRLLELQAAGQVEFLDRCGASQEQWGRLWTSICLEGQAKFSQ